jgi:hypothetical protein
MEKHIKLWMNTKDFADLVRRGEHLCPGQDG